MINRLDELSKYIECIHRCYPQSGASNHYNIRPTQYDMQWHCLINQDLLGKHLNIGEVLYDESIVNRKPNRRFFFYIYLSKLNEINNRFFFLKLHLINTYPAGQHCFFRLPLSIVILFGFSFCTFWINICCLISSGTFTTITNIKHKHQIVCTQSNWNVGCEVRTSTLQFRYG